MTKANLDYAKDHLHDIAMRQFAAGDNFIQLLVDFGGITWEQACDVFSFMQRKKMITLDLTNMRYTVKHGSYLDHDFIEHLAIHGAF
jgi:hypothetical protein